MLVFIKNVVTSSYDVKLTVVARDAAEAILASVSSRTLAVECASRVDTLVLAATVKELTFVHVCHVTRARKDTALHCTLNIIANASAITKNSHLCSCGRRAS